MIGVSEIPCCADNYPRCPAVQHRNQESRRRNHLVTRRPSCWNPDRLSEFVPKAKSFPDLMRLLGVSTDNGGTRESIKRWIQIKSLDTSHFEKVGDSTRFQSPFDDEQVFVSDTSHSSVAMERYRKSTPNMCENCGNDGTWMGLSLSLEIHHKDGNRRNNLRSNLMKLCPNCHSQTYNFKGRKNRKAVNGQ